MPAPRVAVIVPTYQRAYRLPGLVAALEAQTLPREEFEVVVCNDSSTDDTAEVLAELAAKTPLNLRVMKTERNCDAACARNLAWRSTTAPILAFTDDDCVPSPGWLEAGLAFFHDELVGIVQGRTAPDPSTPIRRWAVTMGIEKPTGRYETCNIFYRRSVLDAVGGFEETFGLWGEDTVPGWTARRLGVGERFAPDALVHHEVRMRGMRWQLRWALKNRHGPRMVRRFPEMRRELLWLRLFDSPTHAALLAALVGSVLGIKWRPGFALVVPLLGVIAPMPRGREELLDNLADLAFESVAFGAVIAGSVRERTPMI